LLLDFDAPTPSLMDAKKNQPGEDMPPAQPEQMDSPRAAQAATRRKKMTKQLTGKRDDTAMHAAARAGQLGSVREMLSGKTPEELGALLSRQNQAGETPLFVAAEYGYVDLVGEMVKYHDVATAGIKARSGYDALHIAAKQGDVGIDIYSVAIVCRNKPIMTSSSCMWRLEIKNVMR
jgi:ankyrin repeat protein